MKYLSLPRLLPLANLDLKISSPPATATCHRKTMKDPGIILFGKKIEFPETAMISSFPAVGYGLAMEEKTCSSINRQGHTLITPHDRPEDDSDDNPRTPSIDEETTPEKAPPAGTEGEPKALKKPDKILPCPRCESMDTKFCYYNNSNINQPRHFCKSCQRYWTAGGTMRNMPVGAGRRKKKNPASHFITITQEAFQSVAQIDSDAVHKVLSFGSNSNPNPPNFAAVVSGQTGDAGDDCSGGSTVTTSNSVPEKVQDKNGLLPSQVHWIQSPSWSYYPWNPANPFPIPATFPPGYPPVPIYPPPYWNSVSWLPPASSAPHFPILGKHSRDGESIKSNEKQKISILTPKTLRIDDPDEAAMSSIWATLGIKNENSSRGDLFKAFQEKGAGKKKLPASTNSPAALQANPAALSRSLCFQERA